MPLYTNIGGKLMEIKSLNMNIPTGGTLKPIYGTPKDNTTLHWGGFTGTCSDTQSDFLVGQFTIDSPTYVTNCVTSTDNLNNLYTSVTSDVITQLGITTETQIKFYIYQSVSYKTEKNVDHFKSYKMYSESGRRVFDKNSNGNWEKTTDTFDEYGWTSKPLSVNEGTYYVYVNKYAYIYTYDSSNGDKTKYFDFSKMNMDIEFKFQTLSKG